MSNFDSPKPKKKIYDLFSKLSTSEVRSTMNEIIMNNRNISIEEARKVRILRKNEVKQVAIELGEIEE